MADKKIIEANKRLEILISSLAGERKVGNSTKFSFNGVVGEANARYDTFSSTLAKVIKENEGKALPMDVEISEHDYNGTTYTDRIIKQVYLNGQPVNQKPSVAYSGAPRGYSGDSPETRQSIEKQVALKVASEISGEKTDVKEVIARAQAFYNWLRENKVDATMTITPKGAKVEVLAPVELFPDEPNVDIDAIYQLMADAKWREATVKSWCATNVKTAASGAPLNSALEFPAYIGSFSRQGIDKLIKALEGRKVGQ